MYMNLWSFTLRVHVANLYVCFGPKSSPHIGVLGPKSILFGHMEPESYTFP